MRIVSLLSHHLDENRFVAEMLIRSSQYMGIYTAVHNFCTSQKAMGNGNAPAHVPLNSAANRGGMASLKPY
jgi:hypothetical protein